MHVTHFTPLIYMYTHTIDLHVYTRTLHIQSRFTYIYANRDICKHVYTYICKHIYTCTRYIQSRFTCIYPISVHTYAARRQSGRSFQNWKRSRAGTIFCLILSLMCQSLLCVLVWLISSICRFKIHIHMCMYIQTHVCTCICTWIYMCICR